MVIYNLSLLLANDVEEDCTEWLKNVFSAELLSTGFFRSYKMYRLLDQDESTDKTFVMQFFSDTKDQCDTFIVNRENEMQEKIRQTWGGRCLAFATRMQPVQ